MTTRRPGFTAAAALSQNAIGFANPGAHRYWRLLIPSTQASGTGANDNFAVAEVSLRAFLNGTDVSGGLTYASSTDTGAANDADKAFDDNTTTFLDTTEASGAWVSVDFGVGNDSEVHEITFTNVASATRKAPAEIRIEYSDDNVAWSLAWISIPAAWTDTQETRVFSAGYAQAQYITTNYGTVSPNMTCAGAWGTLLRNHGYTGPALRVEDNGNPGTFTDINFDGDGRLRGDPPYGSDTRVVTLYDQFGVTDLFAVLADNITISKEDDEYGTWQLKFNGNGELTSTVLTGSAPAWEAAEPVWVTGMKRERGNIARSIWSIQQNSSTIELGILQSNADLQWRINGSSTANWAGADLYDDEEVTQAKGIERLIGDASDGSPAEAWYKGVSAGTRTFTSPVTYTTGQSLSIGGGMPFISDFIGVITEVAIFETTAPMSTLEKDVLDDALAEANFLLTGQEIVALEQRSHIILGAPPPGTTVSKVQRMYSILGAPPDAVAGKTQRMHVILGGSPDKMAARAQRLHAIIVP